MSVVEDIQNAAERVKAEGRSKPRVGRHPVNQPMVDHWLDAIGDKNPIYVDEAAAKAAGHPGIVAPPAMIQVWTMMGLGGVRAADDPLSKILELFDEAGYVGVVATNCEQTYHRYLRPGEEVSIAAELTDVVGPKRTALGEAFFITQTITWMTGPKTLREHTVPRICEAAAAAGRPTPRVVVGLPIAVTANIAAARASASKSFQVYGMLPSYRAMLDREGAEGPASVAIVGDESAVRGALAELRDAGTTDYLAVPFPVEGDRDAVARTRALLIDEIRRT